MLAISEFSIDAAARAAALWDAIGKGVNEACILRCEGREHEAIAIIEKTLPPLIAEWSRICNRDAEECRQALRESFTRIQQQVSTAVICRRLVVNSLTTHDRPSTASTEIVQLRRRIPIDDIGCMLDALREHENLARWRQQHFPSATERAIPAFAAG